MLETPELKDKVESLETLLGEFLVSTGRSIRSLSREMKEFKNEMKIDRAESRIEMKEFKDEMKELQYNTKIENEKRFARWDKEREKAIETRKNERAEDLETRKSERAEDKKEYIERQENDKKEYLERYEKDKKEFKEEMNERDIKYKIEQANNKKEFKKEMNERDIKYKIEQSNNKKEFKKEIQAHNKQWGNLANSLGRIVEDITAPSVKEVIQAVFNDIIVDFSTNRTKKLKELNLKGEYDIIAISNTTVYLIEVKTASREQYLDLFLDNIEKFKKLFPEYADKKLIPIFAGLNFEQDFIDKATKRELYVMAFKEWEYMDILNAKELIA